MGGHVRRAGMGQRHRGVAREQHHGHRSADHEAAPEHHHALARNGNVVEIERFQAGLGCGGREALAGVGEHAGERRRPDAVDIFGRGQAIAHGALVHLRGQRAEHEAAVNARVGVHGIDDCFQLGLRRLRRQHEAAHGDAVEVGLTGAGALIGQIVGSLPHAHDGERGRRAGRTQTIDAGQQPLPQSRGHLLAVQNPRHQLSLFTTSAYTSSAMAQPAARRSSIWLR